jgi:outer membrane biosynthesis protein TonB
VTEARQENAPLVFGFIIAILLHLLVAVPALQASWGVGGASPLNSALDGSSASEQKLRERLAKALQEERERAAAERENEVVPGMEKGSDEGMTWIGYEEYQQHLAAHGETDQAAFTEKDAGGGGAPQAGEQAPSAQAAEPQQQAAAQPPQPLAQPQELQPQPPPQPPQPPQQAQAQPAVQPTQPTPPVEAVSAASPRPTPEPSDAKGFEPQPVADNLPPTAPDGTDAVLPPAVRRDETQPNPSAQLPPTAPKRDDVMPEPVPRPETPPAAALPAAVAPQPQQPPAAQSPSQPAPQQPSQQPATSPSVVPVAGLPGSVGPGQSQGERSDRESDATSIADVPPSLWKNGKPLARKGLEIKTKKPVLPILTQLTTRPGNPVCEILFGKDGVPVSCKVLMSSGYPDVDGPVLDALYRWRAKGSQLDKLAPGKTLTFRVRFILN